MNRNEEKMVERQEKHGQPGSNSEGTKGEKRGKGIGNESTWKSMNGIGMASVKPVEMFPFDAIRDF